MSEKQKLAIYQDKLYKKVETDLLVSWERTNEIPISEEPLSFSWKGPKISYDQFCQMANFFVDGYKKNGGETLIYFYYDTKEKKWILWAPPQKPKGLNVEADHETKAYKEQRDALPKGIIALGTGHHHCNIKAGQSNTDEEDETTRDGLHITFGNIDDKKGVGHDFDLRFIHDQVQYTALLEEWFEYPQWITNALNQIPNKLLRKQVAKQLFYNIFAFAYKEKTPYPKQWIDNVPKKPIHTVGVQSHIGYDTHQTYRKAKAEEVLKGRYSQAALEGVNDWLADYNTDATECFNAYTAYVRNAEAAQFNHHDAQTDIYAGSLWEGILDELRLEGPRAPWYLRPINFIDIVKQLVDEETMVH